MLFYYGIIAGLSLLGFFLYKNPSEIKKTVFAIFSFAVLAGASAFRYDVGYDYSYIYAPIYGRLLQLPNFSFSDTVHEPGFVVIEKLISTFSKDYQMLFVATSVLIIGLFILYCRIESAHAPLSIFFFLTMSQYYCSMNFIRQSLAAIIMLFSIRFAKERKIIPYMLIVLFAALFHKSALIMIPFYFINLIPINKYVLSVYAVFTGIIYFNTETIMTFVTQYWYRGYIGQSEHFLLTFDWPFTVFALIVFIILFANARVLTQTDKSNYIYINYAFFNFFFILMGTRHSILDRLSMYFGFTVPFALALLLVSLHKGTKLADLTMQIKQKARRVYYLIAGITLIWALSFHHYSLVKDHHGVKPYQLIFSQSFYKPYRDGLKGSDKILEPVDPEPGT